MESKVKFVIRTEGRRARLAAALNDGVWKRLQPCHPVKITFISDAPRNEDSVAQDAVNAILLQPRDLFADESFSVSEKGLQDLKTLLPIDPG